MLRWAVRGPGFVEGWRWTLVALAGEDDGGRGAVCSGRHVLERGLKLRGAVHRVSWQLDL